MRTVVSFTVSTSVSIQALRGDCDKRGNGMPVINRNAALIKKS